MAGGGGPASHGSWSFRGPPPHFHLGAKAPVKSERLHHSEPIWPYTWTDRRGRLDCQVLVQHYANKCFEEEQYLATGRGLQGCFILAPFNSHVDPQLPGVWGITGGQKACRFEGAEGSMCLVPTWSFSGGCEHLSLCHRQHSAQEPGTGVGGFSPCLGNRETDGRIMVDSL